MSDELEQRAEARVGRILNDKWRLDRLLGVGGMAAVYAARHRNGAKAALKLLHPELAADANVRERFLHEGKAANLVDHPNAVQVLDDDVVREGSAGDEGAAYLVMELLNGESLLDYARRMGRNLREEEVLEIADGVLEVLEAAHAHGIVHRDLKPENLFLVKPTAPSSGVGLAAMLKEWTHVKVLDFGIARIADGGGKTRVGTTLGTPTYMAPEQAQGRRDAIDGRTDLFALGATMWRLLTGARVHEGPSSAEILAKMATVPAAPIRSIAPQLSDPVARIVDRAVKFRREERYPDARTMREDVRAAREGRPLPFVEPMIVEERTAAELPGARRQPPAPSFAAAPGEPTPAPPIAPPLAQMAPAPTVQASPAAATVVPYTDRAVAPVPAMALTPAARQKSSRAWLLLLAILPIGGAIAFFTLRGGAPTPPAAVEGESSSEKKADDDDGPGAAAKKGDDDDDDDSTAKHTSAGAAAAGDDDVPPSAGASGSGGSADDLHGVATSTTSTKKKPTTSATTTTTTTKKPSTTGAVATTAPTSTAPVVNIVPPANPTTAAPTTPPPTSPNDKKGEKGNGKKKGKFD